MPGCVNEPSIWHGMVAGAAAGLISRVCVYPADTVKARLQMQGALQQGATLQLSTWHTAKQVARVEGLPGFYRGFGAVLWGVVPANMAYFGGYELGKRLVPASWGVAGDMAVGVIAQVLAGAVYTPIDIIKERMQVQSLMGCQAYSYGSARQGFASLLQQGGAAALFKGYWATNSVWLPWNVLYISGYETCKQALAQQLQLQPGAELPGWGYAGASAAAAAAAAVATHPADVVKTRLQVLSASKQQQGLSSRQVLRELLAREGPRGLAAGLSARVLNIAPGCALSWALYEAFKQVIAAR